MTPREEIMQTVLDAQHALLQHAGGWSQPTLLSHTLAAMRAVRDVDGPDALRAALIQIVALSLTFLEREVLKAALRRTQ